MLRYVPGLLLAVVLCAPHVQAQDGPFVAGGVGKKATVIPGPALSREDAAAARDLARYLETITGSIVPVATSAEGVARLRIHVGPSTWVDQQDLGLDGLFRDGYVIRLVDADNLVIAGGEHLGTGFGVYDFLKRVCGVRWFMPGPLGEIVPTRERIAEAEAVAQRDTVRARVQMVADAWRHVRCWLSIYVHTGELAALAIGDQADADAAIEIARAIYADLAEKTQWDERVLDPTRYPSAEYYEFYVARHYAEPGALVPTIPRADDAIEAACERVSRAPIADADGFWAGIIGAEEPGSPLAAFARTQRYRLAHELRDPLVVLEDDLEGEGRAQPELPADVAEANRWERRANLPAGYGVWSYTGHPASFVWTDRIAHSGARCIGIEDNEVQANIMRTFPVEAGQRYRVRVFATRVWDPADGPRDPRPNLTIAWQSEGGWTTDPRLSIEAVPARSGEWVERELRIAVPPAATSMVVMLGIDGSQVGSGGAYFDDLRVTRIDAGAAADAPEN